MQTASPQGFCEQDLQNTLAKLLGKLKNPYLNTHVVSEVVSIATTLPDSSVRLQVLPNIKPQQAKLELNFVHILFAPEEGIAQARLRIESIQFNQLMEKVMLPVFIWENRSTGQFELHWQERVPLLLTSGWIWSVFEQSLSLASAFKERLCKEQTKPNKKTPYWKFGINILQH